MAKVKEEHEVTIVASNVPATKDGTVIIEIIKFAPWIETNWDRQRLTTGVTARPSRLLEVEIPVEGVVAGTPLNPGQLAELLKQIMLTVLPTCEVFVETVEEEYGRKKKEEDF